MNVKGIKNMPMIALVALMTMKLGMGPETKIEHERISG
jgi:hypothetical protein